MLVGVQLEFVTVPGPFCGFQDPRHAATVDFKTVVAPAGGLSDDLHVSTFDALLRSSAALDKAKARRILAMFVAVTRVEFKAELQSTSIETPFARPATANAKRFIEFVKLVFARGACADAGPDDLKLTAVALALLQHVYDPALAAELAESAITLLRSLHITCIQPSMTGPALNLAKTEDSLAGVMVRLRNCHATVWLRTGCSHDPILAVFSYVFAC